MSNTKICTKCKVEKATIMFNKNGKNGLNSQCKVCLSKYKKEYRKINKLKLSENRKSFIAKTKNYVLKIIEIII